MWTPGAEMNNPTLRLGQIYDAMALGIIGIHASTSYDP
jgi:hypothetical protein